MRVEKFWISCTCEQSLNSYRQIARERLFRCQGATDIRVNKKCIIDQVISVSCDSTTTDLRTRDPCTPFVYRHKLGPQNHNHGPTAVIHLRPTSDQWCLRPISDRPRIWARPPGATCVTRQKFALDKNVKSDLRSILRPCRMTYEAIECITTYLQSIAI